MYGAVLDNSDLVIYSVILRWAGGLGGGGQMGTGQVRKWVGGQVGGLVGKQVGR